MKVPLLKEREGSFLAVSQPEAPGGALLLPPRKLGLVLKAAPRKSH